MATPIHNPSGRTEDKRLHPFRRAILRGLAVLLPPLLTIVIFLWVWTTIRERVLLPVEGLFTDTAMVLYYQRNIHTQDPGQDDAGRHYTQLEDGKWIPFDVYEEVKHDPGEQGFPRTARMVYRRYIEIRFLKWYVVGPVFICGLILTLYLIGKFLAAGVGRILWNWFDGILHRVPIIRNVYGSVKQVTDFVFSEREIEFTRVVAVEYPRKGIWSLGFVTSESMLDIRSAANEPILTVLMPTSPMPATGFTVNVKKSETIDLNITMDQAFQFIVSCGVVVPPHQMYNTLDQEISPKSLPGEASNENGAPGGNDAQRAATAEQDAAHDA